LDHAGRRSESINAVRQGRLIAGKIGAMIRLIGPGGAGKSTIGALLADRLGVMFCDLDQHFTCRFGDISEYIGKLGYQAYARENVETYCSLFRKPHQHGVVALSSGFMTYAHDIHLAYRIVVHEIKQSPTTFVLLPSVDREVCVAETVRRQTARPFGGSAVKEEAVIRERFEIYMALPMRRFETMRSVTDVVDDLATASLNDAR